MVDKPAITGPVAQQAQALLGRPVRVLVQMGRAPAQAAPAQAVPAPGPGEEDALEAFLASGQSNIIVE
jgi:hypothetical protein